MFPNGGTTRPNFRASPLDHLTEEKGSAVGWNFPAPTVNDIVHRLSLAWSPGITLEFYELAVFFIDGVKFPFHKTSLATESRLEIQRIFSYYTIVNI